MATGDNMVKLVVQLMAEAKDFAAELDKGAKAVEEAANKMQAELETVSSTVSAEMDKAATEIVDGFSEASGVVKEFTGETVESVTEIAEETATAFTGTAEAVKATMEEVSEVIEETGTEAEKTLDEVAETTKESSEESSGYYVDSLGRMQDARGRFVKHGSEEYKRATEDVKKHTDTSESAFSKLRVSFKKAFEEGVKYAKKFQTAVAEVSAEVERMASRLGKSFALAGTAITGGMALVANEAMKFKASMSGVWAGVFDEERTNEAIASLTNGIQDLSMKYGIAVAELTEATRSAMGGGIELADSLGFLEQASMAARAGLVEVKDIVQVTTAAMATFEKDASEANEVLATLGKTANWSNIEWSHLTRGIGALMPTAKMSGMTLEELGGTLAALTDRGLPPAQAMTYLNTTLDALTQTTSDQDIAFEQLGITLRDEAGNARPFLDIMREIDSALQKQPNMTFFDTKKIAQYELKLEAARDKVEKLSKEMGSSKNQKAYATRMAEARDQVEKLEKELDKVRSTGMKLDKGGIIGMLAGGNAASRRAMRVLLDDMENVEEKIKLIGQEAGGIEEQFRGFTMDNPQYQLERFWQALKAISVLIGTEVIGMLRPVAGAISDIVSGLVLWMRENPIVAKSIAFLGLALASFLAVASAVMLGLAGIAGMISVLATIGLPALAAGLLIVGPLLALISGAAAIVIANFDELKAWVMANFPAIRTAMVGNVNVIWQSLKVIGSQVMAVLKQQGAAFIEWLTQNLPVILEFLSRASLWIAQTLIPSVGKFLTWFLQSVGKVFAWIGENWEDIVDAMKTGVGILIDVWGIFVSVLSIVWDILSIVFDLLADDAGVLKNFTILMKALGSALKLVAGMFNAVAHGIDVMALAIDKFMSVGSWRSFLKFLDEASKMIRILPASMVAKMFSGFSASTTSVPASPTSTGTAPTMSSLASSGFNAATLGQYAPGSMVTTGSGDNYQIHATVYQRTDEDAGQLMQRLAAELIRKRGK